MKLNAEASLARKLQIPKAVVANKVGKKYEFAAKVMLKLQVTPNFVIRKKIKNRTESSWSSPHTKIRIPPMVDIEKAMIKLSLTPIFS